MILDTLSLQSECWNQHGISQQRSNQTTVYQLPSSRTYNELKETRRQVVDVCHRPTENVTPAANNERYAICGMRKLKFLIDRTQPVSTEHSGTGTRSAAKTSVFSCQYHSNCAPYNFTHLTQTPNFVTDSVVKQHV